MKKRKTGWIVLLVIFLILALLIGGYFVATQVFHYELPFAIELPFELPFSLNTNEETVSVQSVADILGVGYTGKNNRYSGVVEAKEVIEINPDSNLTVKECYVKAGDTVTVGMPLFSYDVESISLSYEQTQIEIVGLENSIRSANEEIESLTARIEKAKADKQYELKLQLQEVQLTLKRAEYDLKSKQELAESLKQAIDDSVVTSPTDGRVRSVRSDNEQSGSFYGGMQESNAYITIVAGSDYCIKGKVNEQTVHTLSAGMPVTVRLRTDETVTYRGEIYLVNTEEPIKENSYYYYDAGAETSSKYAFYVSLDSFDGLIMGQHVYIELGEPNEDEGKMFLPSYYLMFEDESAFVYAANEKDRIEKREVEIGEYREELDSYEIVSGLRFTDKIAFPDETVVEGALASETTYADNGMIYDFADNGAYMDYAAYDDYMEWDDSDSYDGMGETELYGEDFSDGASTENAGDAETFGTESDGEQDYSEGDAE